MIPLLGTFQALVEVSFGRSKLIFDSFGQMTIVDDNAEFDVAVLGAPAEVCTGDDDETVIDRDELRMVTDRFSIEPFRLEHCTGSQRSLRRSRIRRSFCFP